MRAASLEDWVERKVEGTELYIYCIFKLQFHTSNLLLGAIYPFYILSTPDFFREFSFNFVAIIADDEQGF
jgi:hypothetical protein